MDIMTAKRCKLGEGRLDFARVLKGSKYVNVEYAWKPEICSHCHVFGHNYGNCTKRERTAEEIVMDTKRKEEAIRRRNEEIKERNNNGYFRGNWKFGVNEVIHDKAKNTNQNNEKKGKNKEETEGSRNVNKFDALNGMEEDIEELEKLKGMMQWEIDRDKEAEEENKHIEDVLDNNTGIAKEISIEEMEGWDKDKVDVMVVHMTRQVMLVVVEIIKLKQKLLLMGVLGFDRETLCDPKLEEHSAGGSKVHSDMQEFGGCVNDIEVEDVNFTGLFYTWIKSPSKPETSILKKLDIVMVNSDFIDHYGNVNARFSNFVADKEEFIDVSVKKLEDELKKAQVEVSKLILTVKLIKEKLSNVLQEYNQAIIDEEKLLAQKAKVKWLSEGDRNTKYGYFKSGRGLRQGDPMLPYLFTLVMEILTLIIQRRVSKMEVLKEGLMEFSKVSGLVPNMNKSTIFFGSVKESEKQRILKVMPFAIGTLPMKYLGVPLITKNIGVSECN
ncbi:hypothetical protein Tco_0058550 [Tanacetum coccineum]